MDEIKKAVSTCFNKYTVFSGRAGRPEFWYFALFEFVVMAVLGMVYRPLQGLAGLIFLLPGLAAGARRLHDTNKSGWLQLIGIIPVLGWLVLIYLFAQPGDTAANRFGEPAEPIAKTGDLAPGQ